jgi:hypothetical protein
MRSASAVIVPPMLSFAVASGSSCDSGFYKSGTCNPSGIGATVVEILFVAVIVALVLFAWWWKWGNPNGRVGRFVNFVFAKFGGSGRS